MALSKRLEQYVVSLLRQKGALTSNQLADLINDRYKHGTSPKDIGRNLGRNPRFRKNYANDTWKLKY